MSLLQTVALEDAKGEVAKNYSDIKELVGYVPNFCRLLSISPKYQTAHIDYAKTILRHETLSGEFLAILRMMVSIENKSNYCAKFNNWMLIKMYGLNESVVNAIKKDPLKTPLNEKEQTLLTFVLKTIKDPLSSSKEAIALLKEVGCSEREIFDAVQHGAEIRATGIYLDAFKVVFE